MLRVWSENRLYMRKEFPIFMDFSTFFDTFSHSTDAAYDACVQTNPTLSIRVSIILGFFVLFMACLRLRSSYLVVTDIIATSTRGVRRPMGIGGGVNTRNPMFTINVEASGNGATGTAPPAGVMAVSERARSASPTVSYSNNSSSSSTIQLQKQPKRHPPVQSVEQLYRMLREEMLLGIKREQEAESSDEIAGAGAEKSDVEAGIANVDDLNTSASSIVSNVSQASLAVATPVWRDGMSTEHLLSLYRAYSEHINTHAQAAQHSISELKLQAAGANNNNNYDNYAGFGMLEDIDSVHDEGEVLLSVYQAYLSQYLDEEVVEVLDGGARGPEEGKSTATVTVKKDKSGENGRGNSINTTGSSGDATDSNSASAAVTDSDLRDVQHGDGFGGSVVVSPRRSFLVKVRLLCVLFACGAVASISSIAEVVHLFSGRVQGIEDEDFNVSS